MYSKLGHMDGVIRLDAKQYNNIYVCSDVHNDYKTLNNAIKALKLSYGDLLIIAGDLLDRGGALPNPDQCLRLCLINWKESQKCEFDILYLKGNHEAMIVEHINTYYAENVTIKKRYQYNTIELLESRCGGRYSHSDIKELGKRLEMLPLLLEIRDGNTLYRIAHAAVPADAFIAGIDEEYLLWGNSEFFNNTSISFKGEGNIDKLVRICGHSAVQWLRWNLRQLTETENDNEIWISKSIDGSDKIIDVDCGNGYRTADDKKNRLAFLNLKTMKVSYF